MAIKIKNLNTCDIYVALYIVYMMQGFLYSVGIINQLLQIILLIIAFIPSVKYIFGAVGKNNHFFKSTVLLLLMYVVYGIVFIISNDFNTSSFIYMQNAMNSLLPIFMFYDFSRRGYIDDRRICIYLIAFLIGFFCRGIYQKQLELETFIETADSLGGFTDNSGYLYVTLIPLLYFLNKRIILQYAGLLVCVVLVFVSMKRGAILIALLESAILIFCNFKYSAGKKQKISIIVITLISLIYSFSFFREQIESNAYVALRVEQTKEMNTSTRDELYKNLMNALTSEESITKILLGRGAYSTRKVIGNMAHQDWLETACNNGLIGVVILGSFFISFARSVFRSKKKLGKYYFYSYFSVFLVVFLKTLFSMSIMNMESSLTLLIGYFFYKTKTIRKPVLYAKNELIAKWC